MLRIASAASALALLTGTAGASSGVLVRADGEIGSFRLDVTTEPQIRALAGKPLRIENVLPAVGSRPVGRTLVYRCGRGCETAYSVSRKTRRLSDFSSESALFVTERGSRVGMKAWQAAKLEGAKPVNGCGPGRYIRIRHDDHRQFVLHVSGGVVDSIAYLGPHSVFYEGFC